jgi:carboxyl-terminal processing protease
MNLSFSCSEEIKLPVRSYDNPTDFDQIFDTFWVKMSSNYVYWDIDTTSWDNIYRTYKPLFHQLKISDPSDVQKSVSYFRAITAGLIDCHYYLQFSQKYLPYVASINPGFDRKQSSSKYRAPYNFQSIVKSYLDAGYMFAQDVVSTSNSQTLSTLAGTISHEILFFSCSGMYLREAYENPSSKNREVLNFFFNNLLNSSNQLKAVILDLRDNNGGDISDLNFLVGQFTKSQFQFGFTRYKSSSNRLDFTPWVNAYVNPAINAIGSGLPIVVLADNFTASAAELIALAISNLPKSIFVGENTYGATGPVTLNKIYNDGSFVVGDFLTVQTSSAEFKSLDNKIHENAGFSPDVFAPFDLISIAAGRDAQLEKAISIFN